MLNNVQAESHEEEYLFDSHKDDSNEFSTIAFNLVQRACTKMNLP